jgi:hypothetical protein
MIVGPQNALARFRMGNACVVNGLPRSPEVRKSNCPGHSRHAQQLPWTSGLPDSQEKAESHRLQVLRTHVRLYQVALWRWPPCRPGLHVVGGVHHIVGDDQVVEAEFLHHQCGVSIVVPLSHDPLLFLSWTVGGGLHYQEKSHGFLRGIVTSFVLRHWGKPPN